MTPTPYPTFKSKHTVQIQSRMEAVEKLEIKLQGKKRNEGAEVKNEKWKGKREIKNGFIIMYIKISDILSE